MRVIHLILLIFRKKLFEEIKNKIKEDDESVPYF